MNALDIVVGTDLQVHDGGVVDTSFVSQRFAAVEQAGVATLFQLFQFGISFAGDVACRRLLRHSAAVFLLLHREANLQPQSTCQRIKSMMYHFKNSLETYIGFA